ncbi:MAG: 16S rRNA (adenine(1518)-N(6)/adenine(1519)-N(6))-dimethyltransferase, partial [Mycobacterium sp.]
ESASRLLAASIDPSRRGETLKVADFVRLLQRSEDWHVVPDAAPTEAQPTEDSTSDAERQPEASSV